jgi:hypothetical protein
LRFSGVNIERESDVVDAGITLKDLTASLMGYRASITNDQVLPTSPVRLKEVGGSKNRSAACKPISCEKNLVGRSLTLSLQKVHERDCPLLVACS